MARTTRSNRLSSSDLNLPSGKFPALPYTYIGYVKDNADSQTMGRLLVWVPEFSTSESDETGWLVVNYCSPFAGATNAKSLGNNDTSFDETQSSYGFWMVPPDLGCQVAVFFAGGDPARGFWTGCVYQAQINVDVPDVPFVANHHNFGIPTKYRSLELPVADYNKRTSGRAGRDATRPVHSPRMKGVAAQGLIRDMVRGHSTSSAKREAPSKVFGISTPGPTNPRSPNGEGRLGGHSFVMDDKEGNEHITLKTRSGAQIRIDETNGLIYFINKNGTGWIQIDADGNGDMFFANDFSVRALNDINLRADRDVNIESGRNVNISALKDYASAPGGPVGSVGGGLGGRVIVNAQKDFEVKATEFITMETQGSYLKCVGHHVKSEGDISLDATGNLNFTSGGTAAIGAVTASIQASAVNIDGTVNTNAGMSAAPTAALTQDLLVKAPAGKTNVLASFTDEYNIDRNTQTISTTMERLPTFEPCPEHKVK